jgi:SRSO17 transposase
VDDTGLPKKGGHSLGVADDETRCSNVGVPKPVRFTTQHDISLTSTDLCQSRCGTVAVKMRWRLERDYRELKQKFGLCH